MQITRREIDHILMTMDANDILFVDAEKPLKIDEKSSPTHYKLNEIGRHIIVAILCTEYEITA